MIKITLKFAFSSLHHQINTCPKPSLLYKLVLNNQPQYQFKHYLQTIQRLQNIPYEK